MPAHMTGLHDAAADVRARLEAVLGRPVDRLERLSGGASRQTWAFTCDGRDLILRRDPPGRAAEFGSMALEAAVLQAAAGAGLAVPDVLLVDDGTRLGTAGMVMSRVEGETMARHILRDPGFARARQALPAQLARFVAGLHRIAADAVPSLPEPEPLDYLEEMYGEVGDVSATFDMALRWLHRHRPGRTGRVIVHGDLRLGNVIVGPEGLRAVIDWELLHIGDPVEDLAWICVKAWRFGAGPEAAGLGTIDELLRAYEAEDGATIARPTFDWWLVQKTVQWGIVCMKQAHTHLTGADRSVELAAIGRRVAEVEWDLLELLAPGSAPRAVCPPATADEINVYGRPTAEELLEATEEFLRATVTEATEGQVRFHARVAANVVAMVARQLRAGPGAATRAAAGLEELGAGSFDDLAARIRAGEFDDREDELYPFLWETVAHRLSVANPRHARDED